MANQKISELTALLGSNVADDDALAIVDTSTTQTKKINFSEFKLAFSDGIYLGGTGSANLLNDYEEGTWTPSFSMGGISGTHPISYVGKYVKIGDLVSISFSADNTAGNIQVSSYVTFTGLPFSFAVIAAGTVITEDIDVYARQGWASASGTNFTLSACGSSSGTARLTATATGRIT